MNKRIRIRSRISWLPVFFVCLACSGQNDRQQTNMTQEDSGFQDLQSAESKSVITFDQTSHDFGTILEGEKVVCYFDYRNTGKAELVISAVEATCGCTTPDWSSEPLKPGEQKRLKIIFDSSGRSGLQRKVVNVMSNASNSLVKLTLSANVET